MKAVVKLDNPFDELLDEYLESLLNNYHSKSKNTIRSIKSDLSRFITYVYSKKIFPVRKFLQRVLFSST